MYRNVGRITLAGARGLCCALVVGLGTVAGLLAGDEAPQSSPERAALQEPPTFITAQHHFYNARYEAAAALTLALRSSAPADLANDELRSSALLFQLKGLIERPADKDGDRAERLRTCAACPALMTAFFEDIRHGQTQARAMLRARPGDDEALFFLGKLDLNYVWLQLGTLGRKTGWDEYWEARRSLDAVLKAHPQHVRALVARAWIDYIVDTKMPWGTRWVLGGGSKKRGLNAVRNAAQMPSEFFTHAEAEFALWDMHVREREMTKATEVARRLVTDLPDNLELARFLEAREATAGK